MGVARQWPGLVAGVGLIDPASLLMFLPECTLNFCHRGLTQPKSLLQLSDWFKMDPMVSTAIRRRLVWHRSLLLAEDLGSRPWCCVVASEDHLLPVHQIRAYLKRAECCNCELLW